MIDEPSGRGRAALVRDGVEFDARDAALLREIGRTGSAARASSNLGRSRARDLSRIGTLEDAFGTLVERRRGGSGGGGSRLNRNATRLLDQYDRLQAAITATARVPETVLRGTVTSVSGELADVSTAIGAIRGLHDEVAIGDTLQVRVGGDAITVLDPDEDPDPDSTSARNRFPGTIAALGGGETVLTIAIDVEGAVFRALVTEESAGRLGLRDGRSVVITWKATATRLAAGTGETGGSVETGGTDGSDIR